MGRGYGGVWNWIDPFSGVAVSALTSNVVSTRLAFDLTVSYFTVSGTTSTLTWEISNSTINDVFHGGTIPEASWSQWTSFGSYAQPHVSSKATTFDPPLGYRWARILREGSGATFNITVGRFER
jgi:hypothetical protein